MFLASTAPVFLILIIKFNSLPFTEVSVVTFKVATGIDGAGIAVFVSNSGSKVAIYLSSSSVVVVFKRTLVFGISTVSLPILTEVSGIIQLSFSLILTSYFTSGDSVGVGLSVGVGEGEGEGVGEGLGVGDTMTVGDGVGVSGVGEGEGVVGAFFSPKSTNIVK